MLAQDIVDLSTPIRGVIAEILADRGANVAKGDLVARLEDSVERATMELQAAKARNVFRVKQADTRFEIAKSLHDRNLPLRQQKLIDGDAWDRIRAEHDFAAIEREAARAEHETTVLEARRAEAAWRLTRITSPVTGVVTERTLSAGETTDKGAILKIAVLDPLRVEIFVPSAMHAMWTRGQAVRLALQVPEGMVKPATVRMVDPVADAGTGFVRVVLDLANPRHEILAGQRCRMAGG